MAVDESPILRAAAKGDTESLEVRHVESVNTRA